MKKKYTLTTLIVFALLFSTFTFVITSSFYQFSATGMVQEYQLRNKLFEKLNNMLSVFNKNYIGEIDQNKLIDGMLMGYVYGTGDKYGEYMNAESFKEMSLENNGKNVGIGINVIESDNLIKIVNIVSGSPADIGGILPGDFIVKVGDKSVEDIGYTAAVNAMIGKEGTEAAFTVLRNGKEMKFSIIRKVFEAASVEFKTLTGNIGYVRINEFIKTTYGEFTGIIEKLKKDGVKKIVFDVRNNPGGDLDAICKVLDDILPEGPIIEIVGKDSKVEDTISSDKQEFNMQIAVLVNGNTCSAAELFSAAIQDYKKGVLIGTQTFGKGSMQTIIPLEDGTAIRVTTNRYNPPSGKNYDGVGVTPDQIVEAPKGINYYELNEKNDTQLQAALSYFKG